jgi:hypothetical protein
LSVKQGEPQRSPHQRADFGEAWPWDRVEADVAEYWPILSPFVREIRRRGMDRVIYAAIGIGGPLYLAMTPTWPRDGDVLRVGFSDGSIRLTYLASGRASGRSLHEEDYNWNHSYPPEQAWAAFERFLVRAHWLAKEHPMLAETH